MKYVMTEQRFTTLLAVCGTEQVYSFELPGKLSDEQLLAEIHGLYAKGFLENKENRLVPVPEIEQMAKAMQQAEFVLKITAGQDTVPDRLLYRMNSEDAVIAERCSSEMENTVKLQKTTFDHFVFDLINNEIMELMDLPALRDPEQAGVLTQTDAARLAEKGDLVLQVEKIDSRTGVPESCVQIRFAEMLYWLLTEKGAQWSGSVYSDGAFEISCKEQFEEGIF